MQANSTSWQRMRHVWGVNWALNSATPLQAPFTICLITLSSGKTLVASNVIPNDWKPNATYTSTVNYE